MDTREKGGKQDIHDKSNAISSFFSLSYKRAKYAWRVHIGLNKALQDLTTWRRENLEITSSVEHVWVSESKTVDYIKKGV